MTKKIEEQPNFPKLLLDIFYSYQRFTSLILGFKIATAMAIVCLDGGINLHESGIVGRRDFLKVFSVIGVFFANCFSESRKEKNYLIHFALWDFVGVGNMIATFGELF